MLSQTPSPNLKERHLQLVAAGRAVVMTKAKKKSKSPEAVAKQAKPDADPPAKPVAAKPAKPAADKPAKSASDKPTKPAADKPTKPDADPPAKPVADKPAKPAADKPTKPDADPPAKPTKPAADKPAKPTADKPAKPASDKPAKPASDKPAKPASDKPAKPAADKPAKPAADPPAKPTKPAADPPAKPTKPAADPPAKPAAPPTSPKADALPPPPTLQAPNPTGTTISAKSTPPPIPPPPSVPPATAGPTSSTPISPPPASAASPTAASSAPSAVVTSAGFTQQAVPAGQADPHALTPAHDSPITPEMERCIRRRPGFEYLYAWIDWPGNKKPLGIILVTHFHRVIVSALKPGSLGEEKLKVLDRFITVNGCPVSDKDVAKTIMVAGRGRFGAIVERPINDEARKEFELAPAPPPPILPSSVMLPIPPSSIRSSIMCPVPGPGMGDAAPSFVGSVPMGAQAAAAAENPEPPPSPGDVQAIAQRHLADRKVAGFKTRVPIPILKSPRLCTDSKAGSRAGSVSKSLSVAPCESKEILIPCDTDPNKILRKVNAPM